MSGELKKLKIIAYNKATRSDSEEIGSYEVPFNPTNYNFSHQIEYNEANSPGTSGNGMEFKSIKPKDLSIEFVIDGTGVSDPWKYDVEEEILIIEGLVVKMQSDSHRTPFLRLSWGTLFFDGVLKTMKVNYLLFKRDGHPLRAKINMTLTGEINDQLREKEAQKNSPDLTHYHQVKEGDTLTLMSHRIYGSPKYYLEVARVNNLNDFRNLNPGTNLYFPPVDKTTSAS